MEREGTRENASTEGMGYETRVHFFFSFFYPLLRNHSSDVFNELMEGKGWEELRSDRSSRSHSIMTSAKEALAIVSETLGFLLFFPFLFFCFNHNLNSSHLSTVGSHPFPHPVLIPSSSVFSS